MGLAVVRGVEWVVLRVHEQNCLGGQHCAGGGLEAVWCEERVIIVTTSFWCWTSLLLHGEGQLPLGLFVVNWQQPLLCMYRGPLLLPCSLSSRRQK